MRLLGLRHAAGVSPVVAHRAYPPGEGSVHGLPEHPPGGRAEAGGEEAAKLPGRRGRAAGGRAGRLRGRRGRPDDGPGPQIVSGEEEDETETVEAVFAQARDAEASAEEYLVDDDWKVGGVEPEAVEVNGNGANGNGHHDMTASGRRSSWSGGQWPRARQRKRETATRLSLSTGTVTSDESPGAAADAVLLGRVHGRGAGEAQGPQPQAPARKRVPVRVGAEPGEGA